MHDNKLKKRAESALYHAKRYFDIYKKNDIVDFDIAFAYEAMARAYSLKGNKTESLKYLSLAKQAAENISDNGDKEYFLGELNSIPSTE